MNYADVYVIAILATGLICTGTVMATLLVIREMGITIHVVHETRAKIIPASRPSPRILLARRAKVTNSGQVANNHDITLFLKTQLLAPGQRIMVVVYEV